MEKRGALQKHDLGRKNLPRLSDLDLHNTNASVRKHSGPLHLLLSIWFSCCGMLLVHCDGPICSRGVLGNLLEHK